MMIKTKKIIIMISFLFMAAITCLGCADGGIKDDVETPHDENSMIWGQGNLGEKNWN